MRRLAGLIRSDGPNSFQRPIVSERAGRTAMGQNLSPGEETFLELDQTGIFGRSI
jgi:hypothetical protein